MKLIKNFEQKMMNKSFVLKIAILFDYPKYRYLMQIKFDEKKINKNFYSASIEREHF